MHFKHCDVRHYSILLLIATTMLATFTSISSRYSDKQQLSNFIINNHSSKINHIRSDFTSDAFPALWRSTFVNARGQPLDTYEIKRVTKCVEQELTKYPPGLFPKHIHTIWLLKHLEYSGIETGGTYLFKQVFLSTESKSGRISTGYEISCSLHHEISSILLAEFRSIFPLDEWKKCNETQFKYLGNGVEAVASGKAGSYVSSEILHEGFLCEYGKASVEEDINTFAAMYLVAPDDLSGFEAQSTRIESKARIIRTFYSTVFEHLSR